jgi:hypothetical protein
VIPAVRSSDVIPRTFYATRASVRPPEPRPWRSRALPPPAPPSRLGGFSRLLRRFQLRRDPPQGGHEQTPSFGVDQARIAGLLGSYDPRWGAMADSWDEGGELAATTFDGDRFLKLLDEGIKD